ncbi:hypothetical protein C5612_13935 [Pseudomonas frederiksbergensis]|uniref:Uncharacterized protein n=1 Tax=Pseudomonas frederiksbergensis TaxID=104087 RepID=A0A2S8HMH5_9PSED|nr:hypothetical protein C5612_13935 [Pseudomonas frederiksbergensis]
MWERACSRRLFNIQHGSCLIHRFREQARSHRGIFCVVWFSYRSNTNGCEPCAGTAQQISTSPASGTSAGGCG